MKKYLAALAGVAFLAVTAGGAYAEGTGTKPAAVPVSATVKDVCKVEDPGSIAFGDVDADTHSGEKAATITAPVIKCTKGAGVTVTDNKGVRGDFTMIKGGASDTLAYKVNYTTTTITGQGIGTDIGSALNLTGSLESGVLANVPAGSYTDTLTLTVAY